MRFFRHTIAEYTCTRHYGYIVRFVLTFVVLSVLLSAVLFLQLPLAGAATQIKALALLDQKVQARSALLVDAASGRVLFRRNPA